LHEAISNKVRYPGKELNSFFDLNAHIYRALLFFSLGYIHWLLSYIFSRENKLGVL
jgi:hypothetical protein